MKYCQWSIKCELKCKKRNYLKSEILKSNYCDFNHAYISSKRQYYCHGSSYNSSFVLNCGRFTKYFTKITGTATDDAQDLDLVMPTQNLIEYISNHSETTGSIETIAVSLKYLSIFWRSLEKPLINCKTELKLK